MSFALCWLHHRIITITTITTTMTTTTTAVSSVTDMYICSRPASAFNQPLSTWDGKCRCCLLIAYDESKLFYCRLTYVCRLLCVGCIIESSPLLRSRSRRPRHYHHRSVERNEYGYMFYYATSFDQTDLRLGPLRGIYYPHVYGSSGNVILTCSPSFVPTAQPTALPTLEPTAHAHGSAHAASCWSFHGACHHGAADTFTDSPCKFKWECGTDAIMTP